MAFITLRRSKTVRGTLYAAGGRYEVKEAATLAELFALRDEGSLRCFADSAPVWARQVVRDVTHYYNVAPHIESLVSVNARLPFESASIVLPSLANVNAETMRGDHCDWLLSDGTETLERFVQLFGAPAERKITDGPAQNYYLEFLFSSGNQPEPDEVQRRLHDLFGYLVSVGRLEPAESKIPIAYGRHTVAGKIRIGQNPAGQLYATFDVLATANVIDALTRSAPQVCEQLNISSITVEASGRRELVSVVTGGQPLSSVEYSITIGCGLLDAGTAMVRLEKYLQTVARVGGGSVEFLIRPESVPTMMFGCPVVFGSAHFPVGETEA
jgi:hypothetical protein